METIYGNPLQQVPISRAALRHFVITIAIPAAIVAALALWATSYPPIPLPESPSGAMAILTIITIGVAYMTRGFRSRFGLDKLEALAHSESKRGPECVFQQHGESSTCAPEIEVTIYRIAQESLSNARQHAHATGTSLDLYYDPARIRLQVRDDGLGFDVRMVLENASRRAADGTEQRSSLGLLGMRERAALIRAQLNVSSSLHSGTVVTLTVPLYPTTPN